MEPSLQPSFTFPSRAVNVDRARGLRDQERMQLITTRPKRATDISIETGLQPTNTVPPVLKITTLKGDSVMPVLQPVYRQPRMAEGMTALAASTNLEQTMVRLISTNNASKRGNIAAAQNAAGLRKEYVFDTALLTVTEARALSFELKFPAELFQHLHFKYRYVGLPLDYSNFSTPLWTVILNQLRVLIAKYRVLHPEKKQEEEQKEPQTPAPDSPAGGQGGDESANDSDDDSDGNEEPRNEPINEMRGKSEDDIVNEPPPQVHVPGTTNRATEQNLVQDEQEIPLITDLLQSMDSTQLGQREAPKAQRKKIKRQVNTSIPFPEAKPKNAPAALDGQISGQYQAQNAEEKQERNRLRARQRTDDFKSEAQIREESIDALAGAGHEVAESEAKIYKFYDENKQKYILSEKVDKETIDYLEQEQNRLKDLLSQNQTLARKAAKDLPNLGTTVTRFTKQSEGARSSEYQMVNQITKMKTQRELLKKLLETRWRFYQHWEAVKRSRSQSSKSSKSKAGEGIGKSKRKRDYSEDESESDEEHYHRKAKRVNPWMIPDNEGFFPEGAVLSGRLMARTRDALPISAQIQVPETHQLFERSVRQYVQMPNVAEQVTDEILPIPQYTGQRIHLRPKAHMVPLGRYLLDYSKLQGGTLSIRHPHGPKVVGWPNRAVTSHLQKSLLSIIHKGKPLSTGLTVQEKMLLTKLLNQSHSTVPRMGADINVAPDEKLEIIMGEIDAGNDSKALKQQLRSLIHQMVKGGLITTQHKQSIEKEYL